MDNWKSTSRPLPPIRPLTSMGTIFCCLLNPSLVSHATLVLLGSNHLWFIYMHAINKSSPMTSQDTDRSTLLSPDRLVVHSSGRGSHKSLPQETLDLHYPGLLGTGDPASPAAGSQDHCPMEMAICLQKSGPGLSLQPCALSMQSIPCKNFQSQPAYFHCLRIIRITDRKEPKAPPTFPFL